MKIIFGLLLLVSFNAFAKSKIECVANGKKLTVFQQGSQLKITFNGETVEADGILTNDEVDLVAKFGFIGEMTLFAKIGTSSSENYIFIQGQRNSVVCR
jgi:hypothetical protein